MLSILNKFIIPAKILPKIPMMRNCLLHLCKGLHTSWNLLSGKSCRVSKFDNFLETMTSVSRKD